MGRYLGIDLGLKRTGLAVSDPLNLIAGPLETIPTSELISFLKKYCQQHDVEAFVIGMPKTLSNEDSSLTPFVQEMADHLKDSFPSKPVFPVDERFTSSLARQALFLGGMKKKDRKIKGNIDKVSATLILQSFLESGKIL